MGEKRPFFFENGLFSSSHFYYHIFKFTTTYLAPKTATTTYLYYHIFKTLNHTLTVTESISSYVCHTCLQGWSGTNRGKPQL